MDLAKAEEIAKDEVKMIKLREALNFESLEKIKILCWVK